MAKTYIGANIEVPIYSEGTVNITTSNVNDYFTVSNGSYYFAGSGSTFTSNNKYVSSSTATTTFTAKTDMTNLSFAYGYSSESNYDKFTLTVGSTTVANALSGSTTTKTYSGSLKTGEKIVMTYSKDGSGDSYNDECYVSNISFKSKIQTGTEQKSNVACEVKNLYIGVNNVAKKVKKAYIGVNGVAHLCYGRNKPGIDGALIFIGDTDFRLSTKQGYKIWKGTLQYSTDGTTWNEWDGSLTLSSSDKKLYLRGIGNTYFCAGGLGATTNFVFSNANEIHCYGNIETLLDYQTVLNGSHPPMSNDSCFREMFANCSTLITPPELLSTTLGGSCYDSMFYNCTKLNKLPKIPATTISDYACSSMFKGCSSIKLSTTKTGEYQTPYRIPTTGTGTGNNNVLNNMFSNTGGTFTGTPSINTTYYTSNELV